MAGTVPRALVLAAVSGGLLTLAFPGTGDQGWLAFGALVPLFAVVHGIPWRPAGILGAIAGLTFWLATIPWIGLVMVRYGGLSWLLATAVLLGLAGYLALYWAAFCAVLSRLPLRSGALYILIAASLWVALEFLRTFLFTGFPWNLLGYSQYGNPLVRQIAAVTGVYGVSFVVIAVNAALARILLCGTNWRDLLQPLGTVSVIVVIAAGYGWLQPSVQATTPLIPVALIQGNIDQGVKWDPDWQEKTFHIYSKLTYAAAAEKPRLIVWPETAMPLFFLEETRRAEVEDLARHADAYLLVGALDRRDGQPANGAFVLGPGGGLLGRYDKRHLVPFGEYVPLRNLLFFTNVLAAGTIGEFAQGQDALVFSTAVGRFGVVICYEVIFPGEVREFFRRGADFLVNITNDAWFGRSAAPAQHLAMAVFRAIENRTYLIRAANTGISAIVAPDGQIVRASGLFTPAVVSGAIHPRAGTSLYTRYGDVFAWATVVVTLLAMFVSLTMSRAAKTHAASAPEDPRDSARSRRRLVLRGEQPSVQSCTEDYHNG